jgi:hypothetical protein
VRLSSIFFSCIQYPISQYFNASIRYQYSDTVHNLVVRYPIFDESEQNMDGSVMSGGMECIQIPGNEEGEN